MLRLCWLVIYTNVFYVFANPMPPIKIIFWRSIGPDRLRYIRPGLYCSFTSLGFTRFWNLFGRAGPISSFPKIKLFSIVWTASMLICIPTYFFRFCCPRIGGLRSEALMIFKFLPSGILQIIWQLVENRSYTICPFSTSKIHYFFVRGRTV